MRFSSIGAAFALGALASLSACGASEAGTGGGGGSDISTTTTSPTQQGSLRFDDDSPLALSPGGAVSVGVTAEPAGIYTIGYSLSGEAFDAWIELQQVESDASGHALDVLHAPSQATTFHIRASILDDTGAPGATADREVIVSDGGKASVEVKPAYQGKRPITEWSAAVVADATCADLQATLPDVPAGALLATAPFGEAPLVTGVPAGTPIAVVVRAGHFAVGCTNVGSLEPAESLSISVTVVDEPLGLGAPLATHLTYAADVVALATLMADAAQLLGEGFLPSGGKDGSVLLNAMGALVPQTLSASFAVQRAAGGWDAIAAQHFASLPIGPREQLELWAIAGLAAQTATLDLTLAPGLVPGVEAVTLKSFGDLPGAAAVSDPGVTFTWSTEPNDQVLLSGALPWSPTGLAGAASLVAATQQHPGVSVPQALAYVTACPDLAAKLGPFPGCDAVCVAKLCAAAVDARFQTALAAAEPGKLTINATASAEVGDTAQATALTGAWIGELAIGFLSVKIKGDLTAHSF